MSTGECPRTGKRQYRNSRVAREELRKLRYKRKQQGWSPSAMEKTVYKCPFCCKYHLTSSKKTPYEWRMGGEEEGVLETDLCGR